MLPPLAISGVALAQGQLVGWGDNQFEVVSQSVTSLLTPVRLAGAQESSFVLQRDGTVLSWGGNGNGQRNLPSDPSSLTSIDMGESHGLAILANGSVIGWGRNEDSQATVPAGIVDAVQVAAGNAHSLVLRVDGSIVAWGSNTFGQANVPAGLSARWIASGGNHCLAVLADGTARGWGYNFSAS
jgi:alpha-tubulin suppressor-like RCC1 family protein